jgi:hypothetical protein
MDIKKISELAARNFIKAVGPWPTYNPTADAEWIVSQSQLPWLKLDIELPVKEIHKEILHIIPYLVEHRDTYGDHQGWKSFCIHGKSEDATREDSFYNDSRPYIWTGIAEKLMPVTVNYFRNVWPADSFARLRVMALAPGGIISVHRDIEPPGCLNPVNIAITQPSGCNFYFEKYGIVPYQVGESYMLNISNRHTIINNSNETRYHLIVHQDRSAIFDSLIKRSYYTQYASQINN